jgi:hypothetical protein
MKACAICGAFLSDAESSSGVCESCIIEHDTSHKRLKAQRSRVMREYYSNMDESEFLSLLGVRRIRHSDN